MEGEGPFHAHARGYSPDREGFPGPGAFAGDYDAFERLGPRPFAFDNLYLNPDRVADLEVGNAVLEGGFFQFAYGGMHVNTS
jgi:hypothetical protein